MLRPVLVWTPDAYVRVWEWFNYVLYVLNRLLGGVLSSMTVRPFIFSGQGFSLLRDKNRFVLPNVFRSTVRDSSDKDIFCVAKHSEWKCLVGFGTSRIDEFEGQLDAEQDRADAAGRPFNRDKRAMQLYNFQQVPFDGSGRFTMPEALTSLAHIDDKLFFQGIGRTILIWNPEELYKLSEDPEFEAAIATCRSLQEAELAKAKKK